MPKIFIETLNGVSKEVEYLTPEEFIAEMGWDEEGEVYIEDDYL